MAMPDVRSMFDKEFLYHFDLQNRDVTVTIGKVVAGSVTGTGGKKNKKPVVYFKERPEKGLALNITNVRTVGGMYGFKSEDWIGKRITLYPTTTTFGANTVECIRIRPQVPGSKVATGSIPAHVDPPQADPPPAGEDKGDEPTDEEWAQREMT
jgi:hypothetical protein